MEQSDRPMRFHAHGNFPFLSGGHFVQIIIQQRQGESRHGFAHRTGSHFVAEGTEVADQRHGFRLAVSLVKRQAGGVLPELEHLGIQRFTRGDAVAQFGKFPARKVLPHN